MTASPDTAPGCATATSVLRLSAATTATAAAASPVVRNGVKTFMSFPSPGWRSTSVRGRYIARGYRCARDLSPHGRHRRAELVGRELGARVDAELVERVLQVDPARSAP